MRIIIETNEHERETPIISEIKAAQQTPAEAINGGFPPESLTQTIAGHQQSAPTENSGINAGPPPEWLMEVVKETSPQSTETSSITLFG